ncbi:alpha-2,8-sialyltransferase 8B-like isoform X2 [Amphiura filiformis]|uniref:alpha-2,8-sialyltransferase 8B-like isoform X2 n=1 Tax=Amphiura filiformis TaxID=82378 RepID=UPI003B226A30
MKDKPRSWQFFIWFLATALVSFQVGFLSGIYLSTTTRYRIASTENSMSTITTRLEALKWKNITHQQHFTCFNHTALQQLRKKIRSLFPNKDMDPVKVFTASTVESSLLHFPPNASQNNLHISPEPLTPLKLQRTCAIVGNSGILLNSSCGKQIDTNDMVFRSNIPTVNEFKLDVGNKRNIVTMNLVVLKQLVEAFNNKNRYPKQMSNFRQYNNSIIWFQLDLTDEYRLLLTTLADGCKKAHISVYFAFSTVSIRTISRTIWNIPEHVPSAGLMITTAVLTFCDEISLYGFYPFSTDQHNRPLQYHYFDKRIYNYTLSRHKMPLEFSILQKLHDSKIINLKTESCEVL